MKVKYKIGIQHFGTKDGSEYRAIISITDPNHKVIPINKYYQFDDSLSSSFKKITKEEFELALQSRTYTIAELVRDRILHIIEDAVCGKVPFLTPWQKVGVKLFKVGSVTEYLFSLVVVLLCYLVKEI